MRKILSSTIVFFIFSCVFFAAGTRGDAADDYGFSQGDTVRIAEFLNPTGVQLLLVSLNALLSGVTDPPPAWQTLEAATEEERAALIAQGVAAQFDVIFTSDFGVVEELFAKGELRSCFPLLSEELILAGPSDSSSLGDAGESVADMMGKIFSDERPFFSLIYNQWAWEAERGFWGDAGVENPGDNKNYVESSKNDVTALFQAGDEGAFILVGQGAFAQYSGAQGDEGALVRIAGTGIYRKCYICTTKSPASRARRAASAETLVHWFKGAEARDAVDGFEIAGMNAFKSEPPLD
jgi:ABC-type tungstate transport system permease subunit